MEEVKSPSYDEEEVMCDAETILRAVMTCEAIEENIKRMQVRQHVRHSTLNC